MRFEKQCEWKRGSAILRSKLMAAVERAPSNGPEPTKRPALTCNLRDIRPLVIGVAETACGSKDTERRETRVHITQSTKLFANPVKPGIQITFAVVHRGDSLYSFILSLHSPALSAIV